MGSRSYVWIWVFITTISEVLLIGGALVIGITMINSGGQVTFETMVGGSIVFTSVIFRSLAEMIRGGW